MHHYVCVRFVCGKTCFNPTFDPSLTRFPCVCAMLVSDVCVFLPRSLSCSDSQDNKQQPTRPILLCEPARGHSSTGSLASLKWVPFFQAL